MKKFKPSDGNYRKGALQGLSLLTGSFFILARATAEIVADPTAPKNQQAVILSTVNHLPQVNIQTPNASGVSHNTYSQFNIGPSGVVLNNSREAAQTQLAGWVQGNPYLANGPAKIILNEVNSSNPSSLQGYIEVAGSKAEVVVANPSGIYCDGCGFINASRATLTTGTPIFNQGNLDGYLVQKGAVTINGKGLDTRNVNYSDIIASATKINASIWAKELKITTGKNKFGGVSSDGKCYKPC